MARYILYPAVGQTVLDANGNAIPAQGGGPYLITAYYESKLLQGLLLRSDPLASGEAPLLPPGPQTALNGITVTGTPTAGQVLEATGASTATWDTPSSGAIPTNLTAGLSGRAGLIDGEVITTVGYSATGDGGGDEFRFALGVSVGANGYTRINSSNGQWQCTDETALDARQFGVKADGKVCTDGVTTTASAVLTSATAAFTQADVGKSILLNTPQSPAAGAVAMTSGGVTITGTGTSFLSEIPNDDFGGPERAPKHGGLCIGGHRVVVAGISSNTSARLSYAAPASVTGQTCYTELQTAATIVSVQSATQCTLSTTASISETGVKFFFATDDTTALHAALDTAIDLRCSRLDLPQGIIGASENYYTEGAALATAQHYGLRVVGRGHGVTIVKDLRKASVEYAYAGGYPQAMFTHQWHADLVWEGVDYDGSVPVYGLLVAAGGVQNASGNRLGFMFINCNRSGVVRCGSHGLGARNEHFYWQDGTGDSGWNRDDFCIEPMCDETNGNSVNPGSGLLTGFLLRGGYAKSQGWSAVNFSVGSGRIDGFTARGGDAFIHGSDIVVLESSGKIDVSGLTIEGGDTSLFATRALSVFGTTSASSVLHISGLTIKGMASGWNYGGAAIGLKNIGGTAQIDGVIIDNCTAAAEGGRFVFIDNTGAGKIKIGPNCFFRGRAGSNMTVGIEVAATVVAPPEIDPAIRFGESVTTPMVLGAALAASGYIQDVSGTGTTAVHVGARAVFVKVTGAVTTNLWDPSLTPGFQVTIRNTATQAGTTTVGTVAGTIDGNASIVAAGTRIYEANGTTWQLVGSV